MKICHLTSGDLDSGAARGAVGLHLSLLEMGIDSYLITNDANSVNRYKSVILIESLFFSNTIISKIYSYLDQFLAKLYKNRIPVIFSTGFFGYNFNRIKEFKDADIIHLHWINQGYFNISNFNKFNKIFFWTIRDMWPFTGGCHLAQAFNCEKYIDNCGKCIALGSKFKFDLSFFVQKRKKKFYPSNLHLIGISNWISGCAKSSSIFKDNQIYTIPNSIDFNQFKLNDKKYCRTKLNLNTEKKYVLIGAHDLKSKYKGFEIFKKSLAYCSTNFEILVFGDTIETENLFNHNIINYNKIQDINMLNILYSASDVFVSCSLIESFGKTIAEAMSSGTPCVAFNCTGQRDIIDHKINGYLSEPFCEKSIAIGIEWILSNSSYDNLVINARKKIVETFSPNLVATSYINLYQNAIK
jgi:glycosyltransferase involved in cell wall biosynthesis